VKLIEAFVCIFLIIAIMCLIVVMIFTPDAQGKDWQQQAKKNYRHALVHKNLINGGHIIPPREERGWYHEAVRLNRYVKKTWQRIAHPRRIVSAATWKPLLLHEGWPKACISHCVYIIRRESGGSPTAWNHSTDCIGLFQIMKRYSRFSIQQLMDPVINVRQALEWYRSRGWSPWAL
jgi:hypothetical protein